jgi:AcrR family transcriptional regulator
MGQDQDKLQMLAAARALLARGGDKFSITAVCAEAGVERAAFKQNFSGKAALMAALVQPEPELQLSELPQEEPKAAQEPGVSTPDAWLERRLRVFERALSTLETKQEAMARDHATAIAELEDKLARFGMRREEMRARLTAEAVAPTPVEVPVEAVPETAATKPAPEKLEIKPQPIVIVPKQEMADVLQNAREKVRPAEQDIAPDRNVRPRWLAIGALSLVALFLCVGLTFGRSARAMPRRPRR